MLIHDFCTIHDVDTKDRHYSCRLVFNAAHAIFGGHFPGQPVVPGVCMMEIVKELLETQVDKPLVLRHAGNVKFLQLITPDMQPVVNIGWEEREAGYQLTASFSSGSAALFKLAGTYEPFE